MKALSAILFMLLLFLPQIKAQHYQTVYSDRIAYFDNQYGNVKCIRIDSVTGGIDSVFFPFSTIQQTDYSCFTPYGPSWIGKKAIVNDSLNLFFNQKNDTIRIKTNALLDESWIAYELADSIKIIATIIGFDTLTFLGLTDSVKTIGFQVYDKTGKSMDHVVNNLSIAISMNFGLVRTLNFSLFPNYEFSFLSENLEEFDLIGLSNPVTGIQNLTWFEVFDFQVGDEIHTSYSSQIMLCNGNEEDIHTKTIDKYIARFNFPDSIIYLIDKEHLYQEMYPNDSIKYIHDTVRLVITPNPSFDQLPGEPIISEGSVAYSYTMTNGDPLWKTLASEYGKIWILEDSCWTNCCFDGGARWCDYYKGLGGYCSWYDGWWCIGSSNSQFVYYKKGDKTWGTPLIISDIPDIGKNSAIEISPNPVKDEIRFKISSTSLPATFELIDLSGKTVMHASINTENTSLKLDMNLNGIYLYRIINNKTTVHRGKLVVE